MVRFDYHQSLFYKFRCSSSDAPAIHCFISQPDAQCSISSLFVVLRCCKYMIIFDGTYHLRPDGSRDLDTGSRWVCAWRVRIINIAKSRPTVRHLKPTIVIACQTSPKSGLTSCAEGVGKKISRDFNLDVNRVLWIEHIPSNPGRWHTAVFRPQDSSGPDIHYYIRWRPATPNEIDLIKSFVPDIARHRF
jgi:hypothetical protein